ncbi:hypothetical protein [Agrobacterium vitis]|nr:hypothetical protein [Agrobacterium vitis]
MMKKKQISALLIAASLAIGFTVPAMAGELTLPDILFGKRYNDGVSVERIYQHPPGHGNDLPLLVRYPSRQMIETSQAEVNGSPVLREAMKVRGILVKNVIWVQTAANGGKIVYVK